MKEDDERMCIYKVWSLEFLFDLKSNDISPFPSFHCFTISRKDSDNYEEDESNMINFSSRSPGFVCDMQLWRNVVIVKLIDTDVNSTSSLAIAHNVLYKLGLGNHFIFDCLINSIFHL